MAPSALLKMDAGSYFGISRNFTIYDAEESRALVRKVLMDLNFKADASEGRVNEKDTRGTANKLAQQVGVYRGSTGGLEKVQIPSAQVAGPPPAPAFSPTRSQSGPIGSGMGS